MRSYKPKSVDEDGFVTVAGFHEAVPAEFVNIDWEFTGKGLGFPFLYKMLASRRAFNTGFRVLSMIFPTKMVVGVPDKSMFVFDGLPNESVTELLMTQNE